MTAPPALFLADLTTCEVAERAAAGAVLAVPLGSTEQHGPHLPLSTDTDVAAELCARLSAVRPDVLVAPAVPYGSSGEHRGFAGTLSIGAAALEQVVVELGRSATDTFARLVFVSAHGGNALAVRRAVTLLRSESRAVELFEPAYAGDAHAGRSETSMQLALRPSAVRAALLAPGDTRPLAELMPVLSTGGVQAVTGTGVLGDPTGASAAEGGALLDRLAARLVEFVADRFPARGAG